MIRALWTAATGMEAQQLGIDVIANNLANVNTTGFKKSRPDYQDLLYQEIKSAGTASSTSTVVPTGLQVGQGVKPVSTEKIFNQGNFKQTDNSLDVAIEGDGFFRVLKPDGQIGYTRTGEFKMDNTGRLVNSDGYPLDPAVTIPTDALTIAISADGIVSVTQPASVNPAQVGTIELTRFLNPSGLNAIGKNLYMPTGASGDPVAGSAGVNGFGTLSQGYLEMSNVSVVEEMVNMIAAQRAYEINSKAIQTSDEMLQTANSMKR